MNHGQRYHDRWLQVFAAVMVGLVAVLAFIVSDDGWARTPLLGRVAFGLAFGLASERAWHHAFAAVEAQRNNRT